MIRQVITAVAFLLAAAGTATAAPTSTLVGHGDHPSVAVDSKGTAHVVWALVDRNDINSYNAIAYCRIPAGARSCGDLQTLLSLDPLAGGGSAPTVVVSASDDVQIVDVRGAGAVVRGRYTLVSSDGGTTWATHHPTTMESAFMAALTRQDRVHVLAGDGTLSMIGGSYFAFGLPTLFHTVDVQYDVPEVAAPEDSNLYIGIADDGARVVYPTDLSVLPDGRLFAIGYARDESSSGLWWRAQVAGQDPNAATSWTTWRRLGIMGSIEGVAWGKGQRTSLLYLPKGDAPRLAQFDGIRFEPRVFLGGAVGTDAINDGAGSDLTLDPGGRLHAIWRTDQEGCQRDEQCVVYRRSERGRAFGPKEVVRALPERAENHLFQPQVAANRAGITWAVWIERPNIVGTAGDIRVANLCVSPLPGCQANQAVVGGRPVALTAPRDLLTLRSFTASVTGNGITRVEFRLTPPRCPNTETACHRFTSRVRVDTAAPFKVTYGPLPGQPETSTTDPIKNTLCGAAPYLYTVRATVVRGGARKTLTHDVSYCPRVR